MEAFASMLAEGALKGFRVWGNPAISGAHLNSDVCGVSFAAQVIRMREEIVIIKKHVELIYRYRLILSIPPLTLIAGF